MPLVRGLAPAFLALSLLLNPVAAGAQAFDPSRAAIPTEELQARGIRVLAAVLVALSATGLHGGIAPERIAEAESLISEENRRSRLPMPALQLRRIVDVSRGNTAIAAKSYKIFHPFPPPVTIMSSPITDAFAAPCDSKTIGWPRAQATEMLGVCTGRVLRGEHMKLSDGLHRRRLDSITDVLLGQNAPPSPDRMNLDGLSRTYLPARFIANW